MSGQPGAVMKSQPELPLKVVSGSVDTQRQCQGWCCYPRLILALENMGVFWSGQLLGTRWVFSVCAEPAAPHWLRAPPLTFSSTLESRPCILSEQHSRAGPGGRGEGEPAPMV